MGGKGKLTENLCSGNVCLIFAQSNPASYLHSPIQHEASLVCIAGCSTLCVGSAWGWAMWLLGTQVNECQEAGAKPKAQESKKSVRIPLSGDFNLLRIHTLAVALPPSPTPQPIISVSRLDWHPLCHPLCHPLLHCTCIISFSSDPSPQGFAGNGLVVP